MRSKILFFSTLSASPYWGGSEKYWFDAVQDPRFREAFDCRVMLRESDATRRVADRLRALGVETGWCLGPRGLLGRVGRRAGRWRRRAGRKGYETWYHEIERLRPALVWFNLSHIGAILDLQYAASVSERLGIPYWLILQHAHDHHFLADEGERERFERVAMGASRVVCVSRHNRRVLELSVGRPMPNILMGTNAVTHAFLERAGAVSAEHPVRIEGTARLLCLARLRLDHKGQHLLLEALSDRAWAGREWRLQLVSDGPHDVHVARLVDYYGIPRQRVEVLAQRDDVIPAILDSDLLVMSSLSEAGPYVMAEAMACGRPAVGTPVGRIPELVIEGRTGWLAESTRAEHLGEALERAWAARPHWPRLGAEARVRVLAEFDLDITLPPLIAALRDDAEPAGKGRRLGPEGPTGAGLANGRHARRDDGVSIH